MLWFLRNLNDPDFNPVQEMIHLPIYRHLRRFILSVVVFGSIVLLMLWLPIRLIKLLLPAFLPYNVMLYRCVKWFVRPPPLQRTTTSCHSTS